MSNMKNYKVLLLFLFFLLSFYNCNLMLQNIKPKVIIGIGCINLPSVFNSFQAQISVATGGYIHDKDIIKTEFQCEQNPNFQCQLTLEYFFEEKQCIKAEIFGSGQNLKLCEIGYSETTLGRVIHSGGEQAVLINTDNEVFSRDVNETQSMLCIFTVREDTNCKENIEIKMQGYGLDKKDLFGKSDPYIKMYRKSERGKWIKTYRSEIIKNTLNPDWKPLTVSIEKLCNRNLDSEISIRCFDWDGAKGDPEDLDNEFDEIIGEFVTTAREFLYPQNTEKRFELINNRKKRKKKAYMNSGIITVKTNSTIKDISFIDYMFGGTDLNFIVAIDLTSSNGDIHDPTSLHFIDESSPNEYSVAIQAVLEILQEYDNDELFPAFGFGARVAPDFKICHEYPLTGDFSNPFCKGVEGVISAYQETLQNIKLSGPTYFAPVLRQVINLAKQYIDGSHYFVLLILTDGTVDDWMETKKAVIEASYLPISIIVIGIGGGKFLDMKTLDQDFGLLKVGNEQACRDNVQFVPMRKFLRPAADGSDNIKWSKVALAKEVLAELPEQLIDYMTKHYIKPVDKVKQSSLSPLSMSDNAKQQKLRRCATAYGNVKSPVIEKSLRKSSTDTINGRGYKGTRKCSIDSQCIEEVNRSSSQHRGSFSENHS